MLKVVIEYGPKPDTNRTKIMNAAHVEICQSNEVFEIYVLDVAGEEHMANSTDESLENVYIDGENKFRRRKRI